MLPTVDFGEGTEPTLIANEHTHLRQSSETRVHTTTDERVKSSAIIYIERDAAAHSGQLIILHSLISSDEESMGGANNKRIAFAQREINKRVC